MFWRKKRCYGVLPAEGADLATASFPCVDLSLAGNLKGLAGSQSGAFYGFIKVMRKLRERNCAPRAVLIENVIGFLSAHDGKFFQIALQELAKLDYFIDAFIVDARHFVPQSRPRVFIIGFERSLAPAVCRNGYLFDGGEINGSLDYPGSI